MRLYAGMSGEFVGDTVRNQISKKLTDAFFAYYGYHPPKGEIAAWDNSLRAMALVVQHAELKDHGVMLEYELPSSSRRLDFLVCGRDGALRDEAVIVELKQWSDCQPSEADGLVTTWVAGRHREVAHPCVQVGQYQQYLADTHTAFYEGDKPIQLSACSYLHNYRLQDSDPLVDTKFSGTLDRYPLFDADGVDELSEYLHGKLPAGEGNDVLARIEGGSYRPSRKLMEYVAQTIDGQGPWVLLDDQLAVFEKIRAAVAASTKGGKRRVVLVQGGPGTGKSVLAVNLLGRFLQEGRVAHYATGSRAFTKTLQKIVGTRARPILKYFNNYRNALPGEIDVLICDEAHRIRETSNDRFTRKEKRSAQPQIRELLNAAKVAVFFVDDRQTVRPKEIGSSEYIRTHAKDCELSEFELEVQFRCAGSAGFVNWVNNTLRLQQTANALWTGAEAFDFRIVATPEELEAAIRKQVEAGRSARLVAGYCWKWSDPNPDGTLVGDVTVGAWSKPWNARPDAGRLAKGIPKADLWATEPGGLEQVGCIYTAQGFEFDYVGVIWGQDLTYDLDTQEWVGDRAQCADPVVRQAGDRFLEFVKNTYRVLLSRGMKGCYVHFMDKDTERFVRSRMELVPKGAHK
jgi:hypothetical protein